MIAALLLMFISIIVRTMIVNAVKMIWNNYHMKINVTTVTSNLESNNGYGGARNNIVQTLGELGHEVDLARPDFDVQLFFAQPEHYTFLPNQYKIGYTPWESSKIPGNWHSPLRDVDEFWTTSPLCARWFAENGVTKPIYVYEHGVEPAWTPKQRGGSKVKYLFVGEPSPRKGGQLAFDAFRAAFGDQDDVSFTIKAQKHSTIRAYASTRLATKPRNILGQPTIFKNVNLIKSDLEIDELVALYHAHDVLVYPSWGEGFGFIPLQALATGMPTICTEVWAPYKEFLGELGLNSKPAPSPWPSVHPGEMSEPDFEHLVYLYRYTYQNIDALREQFYKNSPNVHLKYNWNTLTENAFRHLDGK